MAVVAQVAGQADTVGAGAFNAEPDQTSGRADQRQTEGDELVESGDRGRDDHITESSAETVDRDCYVVVLVGIDTDDDIVTAELHAGH